VPRPVHMKAMADSFFYDPATGAYQA